jgi:hypothetical protein
VHRVEGPSICGVAEDSEGGGDEIGVGLDVLDRLLCRERRGPQRYNTVGELSSDRQPIENETGEMAELANKYKRGTAVRRGKQSA